MSVPEPLPGFVELPDGHPANSPMLLEVGQRYRSIGPKVGAKIRPEGPIYTTVLEIVEGGYRVEGWKGCCTKPPFIAFGAERFWRPA